MERTFENIIDEFNYSEERDKAIYGGATAGTISVANENLLKEFCKFLRKKGLISAIFARKGMITSL